MPGGECALRRILARYGHDPRLFEKHEPVDQKGVESDTAESITSCDS
jgi:hypothetical protein